MNPSLVTQLVKNPPAMWETWVQSLGWKDSPGEGNSYPLQYSGLENSMDCIVHGVIELNTIEQLSLSLWCLQNMYNPQRKCHSGEEQNPYNQDSRFSKCRGSLRSLDKVPSDDETSGSQANLQTSLSSHGLLPGVSTGLPTHIWQREVFSFLIF